MQVQAKQNDSQSFNITSRWYFANQDYLVHATLHGPRLTLRNGHKDVQVINRIAKMCGFRKAGVLKKEGDTQYYDLEVRGGKGKGTNC